MRIIKKFNTEWDFWKEGESSIQVNLPHTWNATDGQDGGNDYFRGTCIYKKKFVKPKFNVEDQVYLEFNGVNSSAEIFMNGEFCTQHDGGYSTFRVNITDYLKDVNEIEVKVDNAPNQRVYPQRADFTFYGGIYRDVNLIIVSKQHFDLDYYGGLGIKVTPEIKENDAFVFVEVYFVGDADKVRFSIEGVDTIVCEDDTISAINHNKKKASIIVKIPNVHLWNGRIDPYLYQAKAELLVKDTVVDEVTTSFGCRTYSFNPEKGFFLNGESYPLHGVSRHQDRKGVGNALTHEMHEEDMELILSMGANAIRLAHYQHDQYFYDLCDKNGVIVWAEIPYISTHLPMAKENTISQMKELIAQNYNHPSIICWALSNEISLMGVTDDLLENHKVLNDLVHKMDSSRVTTMANLFMLETDSPLLDIPDIMSYNLYYGWYVGELEDNDKFFDEFHEKYPNRVIGLSEYGADTFYKLQSPNPQKGDYTEQYQALYHEHMLKMFSTRPYLWSTFVWNMFDFAADGREEAGDNGVNHKGLVTFDRKVKKDAYYIYKAWWSKEPFVHLCGRRYVDRTEEITEIKVYSNQTKIVLYVDGQQMEEKAGSHIFTFQIPIHGEHHIEAISGAYRDEIRIRKVDKPNPDYILKGSAICNWFEEPGMEVIPGYYSIKDTIGDIKKSPAGAALVEAVMEQASAAMGDMAKGVEITEAMQQMTNRFTLEKLLKQGGNSVKTEMIVALNQQLTKIKKPEELL
ncbi:glycoside hydrolase family 2 protein [Candidatus Galacturonibacter soehngenii]|uniref:Glycoside hydrolase family 2 protein n=1 Tax=Candidatus Galacturonatibacter soehngenii TaxID=2307010 RepID=A0A7V7QL89_9FIRM|nr:glycoside hydrolase family 2 TIM barrel-domain containing protein [Candidatus Galacturonibacter soehngenii]KAB1438683.1 glycoside hydrolase family 2 protein [Candidatus Galacturonibacter soehngenii]MBA4685723.1 glycoside hydrolase family 2 protein [Candidatus Galacturonibacter soehngenii]